MLFATLQNIEIYKSDCKKAENFLPTARALVGYFEVT